MKSVFANLEVVLGLLMMGFILPLLHPRDGGRVAAFILVPMGVVLIVHGIKRVLRFEKKESQDRKD